MPKRPDYSIWDPRPQVPDFYTSLDQASHCLPGTRVRISVDGEVWFQHVHYTEEKDGKLRVVLLPRHLSDNQGDSICPRDISK